MRRCNDCVRILYGKRVMSQLPNIYVTEAGIARVIANRAQNSPVADMGDDISSDGPSAAIFRGTDKVKEDDFQKEASNSNDQIRRQDSSLSFESVDDSADIKNSAEETWNNSREAKVGMFTALTAFYSLFLTIFALVLELSHLLSGEEQREINTKDMIFGLYMYGVSILFFVYMYVVLLLDPRWYWTIGVIKCSV
ncbi:hypothetical protein TELCIR_12420 [Teladorsagia circumcincta]|uniref:Uncharacterized protein n=1 Tax=Teladorsagia circumcincta TaxID=45464 RepID=A0A2G9U6L7_TELCI|nr:hypothetical protein TELCIR_12420 [Teladorsagia circumcincta]